MDEKELEKIKLRHVNNNIKIYNENKDLVLLYENYIQRITELFDFIKSDNNHFLYTIVFNILMEIGFFSSSHTFNSDKDKFSELSIRPGISIINGEGVCRNVACFYEDIFKNIYNYPLKMCCFDTLGEENDDTKIYGNHVINLTYHEGIMYGFDIMNHCAFKIVDDKTLKGIDNDYYLTYMPGGDLILKLTTSLKLEGNIYDDILKTRQILKTNVSKEKIKLSEYKKLILYANEFITERKKLFQSFFVQNSDLQEEIKSKMLSLK